MLQRKSPTIDDGPAGQPATARTTPDARKPPPGPARLDYGASARLAALLAVGLWCAVALVFTVSIFNNGERADIWIPVHAALATTGALVCAPLYMAAVATASITRRATRIGVLAAFVFAAALAQSLADYQFLRIGFSLQPELKPPTMAQAVRFNMMLYVWIYAFYVAVVALILTDLRVRRNERQLLEARADADRARLDALRLQVNPHFLFNALNAATSLVGLGRNAEAEAVLLHLSEFFRRSLSAPAGEVNGLHAEFDLISDYLEIESVRFGQRLAVTLDLPDDLRDAAVPHFLLQPLIDKAIQNAAARTSATIRLDVTAARVDGGRLLLTVANDEAPDVEPGPIGEGSGAVRERLRLLYGEGASLRIRRRDGRVIADIEMPLDPAA